MAVDFKVNMDDERLKAVTDERDTAIKDSNTSYDTRIDDTLDAYEDLKNEQTTWEQKQTQLQQEQSDFAIQKIEQQKEQAHKDYIKEQRGAYVDWMKQSDRYGVEAEKMAEMGMGHTGYSESVKVSMWNTYQNRIATARASYEQIKVDYDNAMNEARLQNNAALAEIASQAQQKRLELSLNALLAKNDLLEQKSARELAIKSQYDSKWQTILDQINRENQLAYQQEQDEIKNQQTQAQIQLQQDRLKEEIRQFNYANGLGEFGIVNNNKAPLGGYNKNNKAASKGSAASKKVKGIIDAKFEKDAKNSNSVNKNTNTSSKKNMFTNTANQLGWLAGVLQGKKEVDGSKFNVAKAVFSNPKSLPNSVKKKLGLK